MKKEMNCWARNILGEKLSIINEAENVKHKITMLGLDGGVESEFFFYRRCNVYAENSFIAGRMARDERASFDSREISGQRDGAGIAGCTGNRK